MIRLYTPDIQKLFKILKGMFPYEIIQLITTTEKYFGFRMEGSRTRYILNSSPSENNYSKVFIGNELRDFASGFIKNKICQYKYNKDFQLNSDTPVKGSYMRNNCTPLWYTPDQTIELFKNNSGTDWIPKYKNPKYHWCTFIDDTCWVEESVNPNPSDGIIICEFAHTQSVLRNLIRDNKINNE